MTSAVFQEGDSVLEDVSLLGLPASCKVLDYRVLRKGWISAARVEVLWSSGEHYFYYTKFASSSTGREALAGQCAALAAIREYDGKLVPERAGERNERERGTSGREERAGERNERERGTSGREERAGERNERERGTSGREKELPEMKERDDGYAFVIYPKQLPALATEFLQISQSLPETHALSAGIASIHWNSVSPVDGHFGFPGQRYHKSFPLPRQWNLNWSYLFAEMLAKLWQFGSDLHASWPQAKTSFSILIGHTVHQLLGALQADGRYLKPCLVHGNLSADNMAVDVATGHPVLFSPVGFYAHNEFELGAWQQKAQKVPGTYLKEYQKHFPPSEPVAQWQDRIRLYSIYFNLIGLVHNSGGVDTIRQVFEDIDSLNTMYA